jgi:protein SCO1/2
MARADAETSAAPARNYAGSVIKEIGITPKFGQTLPLDTAFVNADGKHVRLGECFAGKPVIVHLVYYECPMLCKLSADGLLNTLGSLSLKPGDDFTIVTISFDPREGPKLSAAARDMAIARCGKDAVQNGWHFLTGDEAAIKLVTDAVGFRYVYDENTKQYAHAAGIFVITPDGTVSRYLGGIKFSRRDVRLSLVEASDGKIGTALDQVMMLCYMYDPTVGRYGFAIMTVMRTAGLLTVFTLATAVVTMIRRDRRRIANDIAGPSWAGSRPIDVMPGQDGRAI